MEQKKRPHYSIVVARSDAPRDGAFIEKVGHYNPMLEKDNPKRVVLNVDKVNHWISVGAQPTEKVAHFITIRGAKLTEKIQGKIARNVKKRSKSKPSNPVTE